MLKVKQLNILGFALLAFIVTPGYALAADLADESSKPATFGEIQELNNTISLLEAQNQVAEQELKLIRNQNLIKEAKGTHNTPDTTNEDKAKDKASIPQTVLIVGAGKNLRARMKFANGTSDDVWIGKRLPGDYVVASITSERVMLRDPDGKLVVSGVAGPEITPTPVEPNNRNGMPGSYPGGSPMMSSPGPMFPNSNPGPITLGN